MLHDPPTPTQHLLLSWTQKIVCTFGNSCSIGELTARRLNASGIPVLYVLLSLEEDLLRLVIVLVWFDTSMKILKVFPPPSPSPPKTETDRPSSSRLRRSWHEPLFEVLLSCFCRTAGLASKKS